MNADVRPGFPLEEPRASLSLLDWRREVADLYTAIRGLPPADGHAVWVERRDRLFQTHEQSPIPADRRETFAGLAVWRYQPDLRFDARLDRVHDGNPVGLPHSADGGTTGHPVGTVTIPLRSGPVRLQVFRLDQYGDHLFLPFVDGTAGRETYGGGRYLLDTAKGADLGGSRDTLVIDFNFAYHPSCVHDPIWSCPLAPPSNRFEAPIRAGEHLAGTE